MMPLMKTTMMISFKLKKTIFPMANIYAKQDPIEENPAFEEEVLTVDALEPCEEEGSDYEEEEQTIEKPAAVATIKKGFG